MDGWMTQPGARGEGESYVLEFKELPGPVYMTPFAPN